MEAYIFYYKIVCIAAGVLIIFLGYNLFVKGIFGKSGDFEGNWNNIKIIIRKAAPGTYFVIFGTLIILLTIFKQISFSDTSGGKIIPTGNQNSKTDTSSLWEITRDSLFHDSIIIIKRKNHN